ncbi:hypothetical protein [Flavobacterium sp. NRK F7]|uniref:hypothetical protein n=1 Tax=Flavobacterium sp. NRK F7 TaxID=2954930 RepID=UPI002091C478|nr:hypothetical protein [Flavobacterium sp. NRK F7]MCO6163867.1 hypothetical protein [Flavobacterium sp. NRK F7]
MKYLKITFTRILLGFFAANMVISLLVKDNDTTQSYLILKIILTTVFYFGLTLYVNNVKNN